ncbi:hypothetical protein [Rhodopirellula bahusiensis]
MTAAFGLMTFAPLLTMQRFLLRVFFVTGTVMINATLLVMVLRIFEQGAFYDWYYFGSLIIALCLGLSVATTAAQWLTSATLRPRMHSPIPSKRVSISDSLELMLAAAVVFGVGRVIFQDRPFESKILVALIVGFASTVALAAIAAATIPNFESTNRGYPLRHRSNWGKLGLGWLIAFATIYVWAVWMADMPTFRPLDLRTSIGLFLTCTILAVVYCVIATAGLVWLRKCGWSLQQSRGRSNPTPVPPLDQTSTDSARSTAETGKSA